MKDTDADPNTTRSAPSLTRSDSPPPVWRVDSYIEGIRQIEGEAALLGSVYILGVLHHAWFVRVEDRDGEQVTVDDPYGRLEDFYRLDADAGPFQTVEVPGFEGEYVLVIYPGSK